MYQDRYHLQSDESLQLFEFISTGPKGAITKVVQFSSTNINSIYNIGFGDRDNITGEVSDKVISNNQDTDKVLATVAACVVAFTNQYPDIWVYATGSSAGRTRLYQIGINRFKEEIFVNFEVYGLKNGNWVSFETNVNYSAFLIKKI